MKSILLILVIIVFPLSLLAQADDPAMVKAKKTLKKRLSKDTPYIVDVKFDGCRVSMKTISRGDYWSDGGSGSSTGVYATDGFSAYLSGGPDRFGFEGNPSMHYEIDLAALDTAKMAIKPGWRKGTSGVVLTNKSGGSGIIGRTGNQIVPAYSIGVNSKGAERTLLAFRDIANILCDA